MSTAFAEYGFAQTTAPNPARTVAINITHLNGPDERVGPLLGRIFAVQSEAVALSRELLTAEIATVESDHEAARIAARTARDAFQQHKRMEMEYQNRVSNAQGKYNAANRILASERNMQMDVYASPGEIAAHKATIEDAQRNAEQAEAELLKANQEQNLYYSHGERLANEYNTAQIRFADCDSRLNQLKLALAELAAQN